MGITGARGSALLAPQLAAVGYLLLAISAVFLQHGDLARRASA